MSRRTRIVDLLESSGDALTAREISRELGIGEPTIVRDLRHIARSLRGRGEVLLVRPASCGGCGFEFQPDKLSSPGKCPNCRSTRVYPPAFTVTSEDSSDQ